MSQRHARLVPGDEFTTAAVDVTEEMRADMVRIGGYTHPLFSRPGAVSLPTGSPLPGQGVLLLMGGLVEQSGRLDDAVVLMGLADVRFRRPAVAGSRVAVHVEVVAETPHRSENCVRTMRWTAVDGDTVLVTATAAMLVRPAQPVSAS
jgi:hypothetical protein